MICITIQRTLSVAKVRYLIGDKECFKIFYPRFFAWINLFSLNHILLYSLLFPFQSIQNYVAMVSVFWMVYFVCIFSSFRVFCIKVSRRRRKTVLVPQTNFLRLWHGKKNPWRYALKYFKTILSRTFLCLPCWQRLTFIATTRSSIFLSHNPNDMKQWHATLSCLSSTAWGKVLLFVGCRLTDQKKHHSLICRTILFAYSIARKKSLM